MENRTDSTRNVRPEKTVFTETRSVKLAMADQGAPDVQRFIVWFFFFFSQPVKRWRAVSIGYTMRHAFWRECDSDPMVKLRTVLDRFDRTSVFLIESFYEWFRFCDDQVVNTIILSVALTRRLLRYWYKFKTNQDTVLCSMKSCLIYITFW